jgi:hypothetical protein
MSRITGNPFTMVLYAATVVVGLGAVVLIAVQPASAPATPQQRVSSDRIACMRQSGIRQDPRDYTDDSPAERQAFWRYTRCMLDLGYGRTGATP